MSYDLRPALLHVQLCWIFENRSWKDTDRELREYNDELVQRIARLEGMVPVTPMQDDHDMSLTLSQVHCAAMHVTCFLVGSVMGSVMTQ